MSERKSSWSTGSDSTRARPAPVERERAHRQLRHRHVLQIIVEKSLDARVGGAEVLAEQAVFFARLRGKGGGDLDELLVAGQRHGRAADEGELDVDVRNEMCGQLAVHGGFSALRPDPLPVTMPFILRLAKHFLCGGCGRAHLDTAPGCNPAGARHLCRFNTRRACRPIVSSHRRRTLKRPEGRAPGAVSGCAQSARRAGNQLDNRAKFHQCHFHQHHHQSHERQRVFKNGLAVKT